MQEVVLYAALNLAQAFQDTLYRLVAYLRKAPTITTTPTIISRSEHTLSRSEISENALKVLYRLKKAGYEAFLVGGGVRDILLGLHPKDFDVATDARPEDVKHLFRNCRLIGRRFRLAHVFFGRDIIEVATFRAHHEEGEVEGEGVVENGMILRDNVYGTLEDDAWRRDFTVNALYYSVRDFSVLDYTGGMQDLRNGVLRIIGDPGTRFQEDPVRMLRAIRFAAKLGFKFDPEMDQAIHQFTDKLQGVPAARLFEEVLKLFLSGHAVRTYELLCQYGLFNYLFAATHDFLQRGDAYTDAFIRQAMANTDERIANNKPVTPAFLFAALLWSPVRQAAMQLQTAGMTELQALQEASYDVTSEQLQQIALPKRFRLPMREIWTTQARLTRRRGKRPYRLMDHPRFRASYDFMLLRNSVGEPLQELCDWWTQFQEEDGAGRNAMCKALSTHTGGGRNSQRRRHKQKPTQGETKE